MPHMGELLALVAEAMKEPVYALRFDSVDATTAYKGEAYPGTLDSDAGWRVQRMTFSGDDVTIKWASGGAFSEVWDNRASLTYS